MQVDMHYYGTYAMARAAGLRPETCKIIATAAQYVDDNANNQTEIIKDGARVDVYATAHHWYDVKNVDERDQRLVWIPFHFLPGNEGGSYTERLICRQDSKIAQEMIAHHLNHSDRPFIAELMGVAAHVYADTFSHYGFSGIGSRRNRIINDTIRLHGLKGDVEEYVRKKAEKFFKQHGESGGLIKNIRAFLLDAAEALSGALGHGAVATYPDRPYLHWDFIYEHTNLPSDRENQVTFLAGCEALHGMFRDLANQRPDLTDGNGRDFANIEDRVNSILGTQAHCEGRIKAWQTASKAGDIFTSSEEIPIYDENKWHHERSSFSSYEDSKEVRKLSSFRFFQSAALHRTYVLRDLLPTHGIVID